MGRRNMESAGETNDWHEFGGGGSSYRKTRSIWSLREVRPPTGTATRWHLVNVYPVDHSDPRLITDFASTAWTFFICRITQAYFMVDRRDSSPSLVTMSPCKFVVRTDAPRRDRVRCDPAFHGDNASFRIPVLISQDPGTKCFEK